MRKTANRISGGDACRKNAQSAPDLNNEQRKIQKWLTQVKFKKCVIGGVDETDVWKRIQELNALYEAALSAERVRYDTLLQERFGGAVPETPAVAEMPEDFKASEQVVEDWMYDL